MLPRKDVGASEKGAMPDSHRHGETSEAVLSVSEERTVDCHTVLMQTEVRDQKTSAQRAAWCRSAHIHVSE